MSDNKTLYRSKYEAYPFLCDDINDLRCDFEIATDEIASYTGLLASVVDSNHLKQELLTICDLVYHINPSLRTKVTVTTEELEWLENVGSIVKDKSKDRCKRFVVTQGCTSACYSHILRAKCKGVVRLLYRHSHQGHSVDPLVFDFLNLLSGYFFYLALYLNEIENVDEIDYISRNYK